MKLSYDILHVAGVSRNMVELLIFVRVMSIVSAGVNFVIARIMRPIAFIVALINRDVLGTV